VKIDVHVHLLGDCKDIQKALNHETIYYNPEDNQNDLASFFVKRIVISEIKSYISKYLGHPISGSGIPASDYLEMIYKLLVTSKEIDSLVLLAMDANYSHISHELQIKETDLLITNKFLFTKINKLNSRLVSEGHMNKRFLFGASVNPNRLDWEQELNYVINETDAVLLKLLPSVHDVHLDDRSLIPFFHKVRDANIPILCHVGPELAFAEGMNNTKLDQYHLLDYPLKEGVKVIACHMASPFFPGEEKKVIKFADYINKKNANGVKLWADTSATMASFRTGYIRRYVKDFNPGWLIHGSDMPVPVNPWNHMPWISYSVSIPEFFGFLNEKNLLDQDIKIKRAHEFADSILSNAQNVLRMPKNFIV
jgi:predicted TIM-barrel fold metal-dependent hydrolase